MNPPAPVTRIRDLFAICVHSPSKVVSVFGLQFAKKPVTTKACGTTSIAVHPHCGASSLRNILIPAPQSHFTRYNARRSRA
jgi:hypothetical protein